MSRDNGRLGMSAVAQMVRGGGIAPKVLVPKFRYDCQLVRAGKVIDEFFTENVVTTEGGLHLLDTYFKGSAYTAAWYCGLISSVSYTVAPDITDVASGLNAATNGWAECSASYAPNYSTPTGTNRGAITFGTSTGTDPVSLSSSATIDFTFSEAGTVKGAFLVSTGTRLGTTGKLYSGAVFGADKAVVSNDQLKVTVQVSFDLVYTP